ncbi:hypothetical protein MUK42_19148 [Musa troglodytarum]|uniref:Uncharacterized protein n=1 Tax=Musa troglodytarum TaxID=320322 RepID=A0A9E7K313_9LILI|nr:hypothetical protein MUK42_19148 [Musa troglodytarum]
MSNVPNDLPYFTCYSCNFFHELFFFNLSSDLPLGNPKSRAKSHIQTDKIVCPLTDKWGMSLVSPREIRTTQRSSPPIKYREFRNDIGTNFIVLSFSISLSHQLQWSCERIGREEKESSSPFRFTEALDLRKRCTESPSSKPNSTKFPSTDNKKMRRRTRQYSSFVDSTSPVLHCEDPRMNSGLSCNYIFQL